MGSAVGQAGSQGGGAVMPIMNLNFSRAALCLPQMFLRKEGTLQDLQSRYAITHRRHSRYPNLVQLKYDQLMSPFNEPIVQESRGIILDEDDGWNIVAWPFKKFFNYGEPLAATIDWRDAVVQEKADGSLCILYHYDDQWHVATSGSPDAGGKVGDLAVTFDQLFWITWDKMGFKRPSATQRNYTFMFELTSQFNHIVVEHEAPSLQLLAIRSTWSGMEFEPHFSPEYRPVKTFPLGSIEAIVKTFDEMSPRKQEGYVVVDGNFNRIKVKHPGYVALHHLKSSFSMRRIVEVVRKGEAAEVRAALPEWSSVVDHVQASFDGLATHLQQRWDEIKDIDDRKQFAAEAKVSPYFPTMFHLKDGTYKDARESLASIHLDTLIDLLGVKGMQLEGAI